MSEVLLQEILSEIKSIKGEISTIKGEISTIKGEISTIKGEVSTIKGEISTIKGEINTINNRLDLIEGQQSENTAMLKAVLHRTEELDAKFDGILHTTATKDAINRLDAKFDTLNSHLFNQEVEIRLLKKAL